MKRNVLLIICIVCAFSFFGCTKDQVCKPVDARNLIFVSENIFFDNLTKRYVFSAEGSVTRSEELTQEYEAILRENKILDSLTQDAKSKGYDLNIVYVKPNNKSYSEKKAFPDDSTGTFDPTDPGNSDPADSSVVNYSSISGTLLNRESYLIEDMSIGSGYIIELEGYVSASSHIIRGVSSKTYHNLQFMANNLQSCLLTTATGGDIPIESIDYILNGSSVMNGPVNDISVFYYNSEINKDITWSCNYMIVYSLPQSYS